jgi:hypothetical protein
MKLKLTEQWNKRLDLRAEGEKLLAEGEKLLAEGNRLTAEGSKLLTEGDKLRVEGETLWIDAILEAYGNITVEWKFNGEDYDCILENGERYKC